VVEVGGVVEGSEDGVDLEQHELWRVLSDRDHAMEDHRLGRAEHVRQRPEQIPEKGCQKCD
jgi:hypothetical protein